MAIPFQSQARTRPGEIRSNLGRATVIVAMSLVAFVPLLVLLERAGVDEQAIGIAVIGFVCIAIVVLGFVTRTVQAVQFYAADHAIHPVFNGMALAASWLSIGLVGGFAGSVYAFGFDGVLAGLGWMGGFALLAILFATGFRKSGALTVPDFLAMRYGDGRIRVVATLLVIACCGGVFVLQIALAATVAAGFLGIDTQTAIVALAVAVGICTVPGGMRGATWTQITQFIVIAIAFMTPAFWAVMRETGSVLPAFAADSLSTLIGDLETTLVRDGMAAAGALTDTQPILDRFNRVAVVATIAAGVSAMPHLMMRTATTTTVSGARWSAFWALLLIGIFVTTAPVYALMARLEIYRTLTGLTAGEVGSEAGWMFGPDRAGGVLPISLCGAPVQNADEAVAACGSAGHVLTVADIAVDPSGLTLAFPDLTGLSFVATAMLVGGLLAAALSTASGLAMAMATSLSHDIYVRLIDPRATANRRMFLARLVLIGLTAGAAWLAAKNDPLLPGIAEWALPLSAAGLFPALAIGVLWRRTSASAALFGMLAGTAATAVYLWGTRFGIGGEPWPLLSLPGLTDAGILPLASGVLGIVAGSAVIIAVSLAAPPKAAGQAAR